jgi:hypothetical protein
MQYDAHRVVGCGIVASLLFRLCLEDVDWVLPPCNHVLSVIDGDVVVCLVVRKNLLFRFGVVCHLADVLLLDAPLVAIVAVWMGGC